MIAAYIQQYLAPKYAGPFTVTKGKLPLVYEVTDTKGRTKVAYVNDLKPYRRNDNPEVE